MNACICLSGELQATINYVDVARPVRRTACAVLHSFLRYTVRRNFSTSISDSTVSDINSTALAARCLSNSISPNLLEDKSNFFLLFTFASHFTLTMKSLLAIA